MKAYVGLRGTPAVARSLGKVTFRCTYDVLSSEYFADIVIFQFIHLCYVDPTDALAAEGIPIVYRAVQPPGDFFQFFSWIIMIIIELSSGKLMRLLQLSHQVRCCLVYVFFFHLFPSMILVLFLSKMAQIVCNCNYKIVLIAAARELEPLNVEIHKALLDAYPQSLHEVLDLGILVVHGLAAPNRFLLEDVELDFLDCIQQRLRTMQMGILQRWINLHRNATEGIQIGRTVIRDDLVKQVEY